MSFWHQVEDMLRRMTLESWDESQGSAWAILEAFARRPEPDLSGNPDDPVPGLEPARATTFNDPSVGGEYPTRPTGAAQPISQPATPFASREPEKTFSQAELEYEPPKPAPVDRFSHLAPAGSKKAASQAQTIKKKLQPGDKRAIGTGIGRMKVR